MQNSITGKLKKWGHYISNKREEVGIGLTSIEHIAKNEGGGVHFYQDGNVFMSEVYLEIEK